MGGYAAFVWPAYGVVLIVLGGLSLAFLAAPPDECRRPRAAAARAWYPTVTRKQQRLSLLALGMAALAGATALVLVAFSDNLVFFYSPSELKTKAVAPGRRVRIGGLVEDGSVLRGHRRPPRSCSALPMAQPTSPSSTRGFCPTCFARGRAWSPREACGPTAFSPHDSARQARRKLHAARGRRRIEEERALAGGRGVETPVAVPPPP